MKEQLVYLGVDIAKSYLDAAVGNEKRRFSNDAIGHRELIKWVKQLKAPVHRAHRLLSESTLILCTLSEQAPLKANARRLHRNWSIPEPIVISDQNGYSTLSEFRRELHF